MPNPAKGPRLATRSDRGRRVFVIKDGDVYRRTGCGIEDRSGAEAALEAYLAEKRATPGAPKPGADFTIADALAIYGQERGPKLKDPQRLGFCIDALLPFWGDLPVSAIKAPLCRRYAAERKTRNGKPASAGTTRRELGVLHAAVEYCHDEGYLTDPTPKVKKPPRPPRRECCPSRTEIAALLRQGRRNPRLSRLILICYYTGSRSGVIRRLQKMPNTEGGHYDAEKNRLHRLPAGAEVTKKRAPIARVPRKLANHLRRWLRMADTRQWFIEWDGAPLDKNPRKAWAKARIAANEYEAARAARKGEEPRFVLEADLTPHALRHAAITHMIQAGAKAAHVSSLAGITLEELEATYLHHSPDHQQSAIDAMGG